MKRFISILIILPNLWITSLMGQIDALWNCLLPNGMDFSLSTADHPYSYRNSSALSSLQGIVSTGYMYDTLFATDGQTLYVIYNDSIVGQYHLNRVKAGRNQAFIFQMFYGNEKHQLKIITSVDDSLKLFTWPDIAHYTLIATDIEPVIDVAEYFDAWEKSTSATVSFIDKVKKELKLYKFYFSSGILKEELEADSILLSYDNVNFLRKAWNLCFVASDGSIGVWKRDYDYSTDSYHWKKITDLQGQARDIYISSLGKAYILFDTSIYTIYSIDYEAEMINGSFVKLKGPHTFRQIIASPYGELLLYPSGQDSIYSLYHNYGDKYFLFADSWIVNPYPYYINQVDGYYPLFTPWLYNPYTYCQHLEYYLDPGEAYNLKASVDIPHDSSIIFVHDTISLDTVKIYPHSGQNYFIVSSVFQGRPVDVNNEWDYISAEIDDNLIVSSNIRWYCNDSLLPDTTSELDAYNNKGLYTMKIVNPYTGCVYQKSTGYSDWNNDFNWVTFWIRDEKTNIYDIDHTQFYGGHTHLVARDTLLSVFSTENYNSESGIKRFYFWDGRFIGNYDTMAIPVNYSALHYLDILWKPEDSLTCFFSPEFTTLFPVITPKIKNILPDRRYKPGDTIQIVVSNDTNNANADIMFNDFYAPVNKFKLSQINDSIWQISINSPFSSGKVISNPDSLSLILWLATNDIDKLSFSLISPDGKRADFYTGFSAEDARYFVGQPYSKKYVKVELDTAYMWDVANRLPYIDFGYYPVVFSGYEATSLGSNAFYFGRYVDLKSYDKVYFLKTGENVFHGDFSNLKNAEINGKWTLVVHNPDPDSILIFAKPILEIPFQYIGYYFLEQRIDSLLNFEIYPDNYQDFSNLKDSLTFVINDDASLGEDSIIFYFNFSGDQEVYEGRIDVVSTRINIKLSRENFYYNKLTDVLSPNGDGQNDTWNPVQRLAKYYPVLKSANPSAIRVNILDDQGEIIRSFTVAEQPQGWDGTDYNGQEVKPGVYWYFIVYLGQKFYGTILLVK